jgi:hypothetical protein
LTRINTFKELGEEEDGGQNMYAGGKNSGIAIQGRKDPSDDLVKKILEQAEKGGQEEREHQDEENPKFGGTGTFFLI